jgi:hypothetical protein
MNSRTGIYLPYVLKKKEYNVHVIPDVTDHSQNGYFLMLRQRSYISVISLPCVGEKIQRAIIYLPHATKKKIDMSLLN